jgi:polyisoprenoid-binding protein YceI
MFEGPDTMAYYTRDTGRRRWLRWLLAGIVVLVILAVAGPFIYNHYINKAPAPLSLSSSAPPSTPAGTAGSSAPASTAATGSVAGSWTPGPGSVVGYRVNEVLLGQSGTAVGRTTSVTGHMTIQGTTVTAATFSVPMASVHSNEGERDNNFDGRIMEVATYPTATFTLTSPIDLAPLPADGVIKQYTAHGNLTLHGTTHAVTFTLSAKRTGSQIEVSGDIPVVFADYNIENPSYAGLVTTQNHGLLEFLLVFNQA